MKWYKLNPTKKNKNKSVIYDFYNLLSLFIDNLLIQYHKKLKLICVALVGLILGIFYSWYFSGEYNPITTEI